MLREREYIQYKANITELPLKTIFPNTFFFKSYQKLTSNLISPHTKFNTIIVKYETGVGKTPTSILSAINHVEYMRSLGIELRVFVISFNKGVFVRELISKPEFGFVTQQDLDEAEDLRKSIRVGIATEDSLKNLITSFKRRLASTFHFIGFREFSNDLYKLQKDAEQPQTYSELINAIKSETVKLNLTLLNQLENSFIIADEFHKTYSSVEINNYGIALKFIFDLFSGELKIPQYTPKSIIKTLLMSATPHVNKPTEVVDILNLITPGKDFKKKDFFITKTGSNNEKIIEFLPDTLEKFRQLFTGKVCYVKSSDLSAFPSRSFEGTSIPNIPYLKFIECIMSSKHEKISRSLQKLSIEQSPIVDYIIPIPTTDGKSFTYEFVQSKIVEAYRINPVCRLPPVEKGQEYSEIKTYTKDGFLHFTGIVEHLNICSTKYQNMLEILKKHSGKTIIYHENIRSSGVIFIGDLLHDSGYIELGETASDTTICVHCNIERLAHSSSTDKHNFEPTTYVIVHGEMTKANMFSILDKFNNPDNTFGDKCKILIGSRVILESLNFTSIQNHFIMHYMRGIGELIQNLGRSVRMGGSVLLPPNLRHVRVFIFMSRYKTSTQSTKNISIQEQSHEEKKYIKQMDNYLKIQQIEKIMHEVAIDASLNAEINKTYSDSLTSLKFSPPEFVDTDINVDDSQYFKYFLDQVMSTIIMIIKIMFSKYSKIWTIDDLWNGLLYLPINYEIDKKYISRDVFILCVNFLVDGSESEHLQKFSCEFPIDGISHRIFNIEEVYPSKSQMSDTRSYLIALPVTKQNELIGISTTSTLPKLYYDMWYRPSFRSEIHKSISITQFLSQTRIDMQKTRINFFREHLRSSPAMIINNLRGFTVDFYVYLIKYCVRYMFNVLIYPKTILTEYHTAVMNVLYIFEELGYIIYASELPEKYFDMYSKFISDKESSDTHDFNSRAYNHMLESKFLNYTKQTITLTRINEFIINSNRMPRSNVSDIIITHEDEITPVPAYILPVGMSLATTYSYEFKLYNPSDDSWIDKNEPLFNITPVIENDIIVGYETDSAALGKQFKVRKNISHITSNKRLINKGMVCTSFRKKQAQQIAKELGMDPKTLPNKIKEICSLIRIELIKREINSRKKGDNIKWFYFSYEYNPLRH